VSQVTAFSFSRLKAYEECPKKYYAISAAPPAQRLKEAENEHMAWGTSVHLAFKNYFEKGTPLPLQMKQYEKFLAEIKKMPGTFVVEQKLAINTNYEATGWFDNDVYCRIISDLTILHGKIGVMWDWKTGKQESSFLQLKLAAAVMFLLVPELEKIVLAYLWTKTKKITKLVMLRDEMPGVWAELLPRIERYHMAHVNKEFPPRPNPYCKGCIVTSCPHWEPRRG
jgi:CRISPR/Cas system-associated exonuclease Cas4 (RecB family)